MNEISFKGFMSPNQFKDRNYDLEYLLDPSQDEQVRDILPMKISKFEIKKIEWSDFVGQPSDESPWIAHCYWNIEYEYQKVIEKEQQLPPIIKQQSPRLPPKNGQIKNNLPQINQKNQIPQPRTSSVQRTNRNQSPQVKQIKSTRSNSSQNLRRPSPQLTNLKVMVNTKFSNRSWAKYTNDDDLLEHETGHYLIGCLCALEFKKQAEQLLVNTNDTYQTEIKKLFQTILRTFLKIEKDYDDQTKHYVDWDMQKKWNRKIKEQLLLYELYFN